MLKNADPSLLHKWRSMVSRCYGKHECPTLYQLHNIKICDEWLGDSGFYNFQSWAISNGYKPGLFIDRVDTRGNYAPDNCRFVTQKENNRNRRDTVYVQYNGESVKLCELCEALDVPRNVVYSRLKNGWSAERAVVFDKPYAPRKNKRRRTWTSSKH